MDSLAEEIYQREKELSLLKRRRNTLLPVARLVSDILMEIFLYLKPSCNDLAAHPCDWAQLSQVYSTWRYVALACPSLWTTVNLNHARAAPILLSRSKSSPLSITTAPAYFFKPHRLLERPEAKVIEFGLDAQGPTLQSLAPQIRRLRLRDIPPAPRQRDGPGANHSLILPLLKCLNTSMPHLESLLFDGSGDELKIPPDFLSGGTPALRHLTINNYIVDGSTPILRFPQLHSLDLSDVTTWSQMPARRFLDAFACLGQLQRFSWTGTQDLPMDDTHSEGPAPLISWPQLREMQIAGAYTDTVAFLSLLRIPPGVSLGLTCGRARRGEEPLPKYDALHDLLLGWYSGLARVKYDVELHLHEEGVDLDIYQSKRDSSGLHSVHLSSLPTTRHVNATLATFPTLGNVLVTDKSGAGVLSLDTWPRLHSAMVRGHTLELQGHICASFFGNWRPTRAAADDLSFPLLTQLTLSALDITSEDGATGASSAGIVRFVREHAAHGVLRSLYVKDCDHDEEGTTPVWYNELADIVDTSWA